MTRQGREEEGQMTLTDQERIQNLRDNYDRLAEQLAVALRALEYYANPGIRDEPDTDRTVGPKGHTYTPGKLARKALKEIQEIATRCCRD